MNKLLICTILSVGFLVANSASAVVTIPPSAEIERADRFNKPDLQKNLTIEPKKQTVETPVTDLQDKAMTEEFLFNGLVIEGASNYDPEDFQHIYKKFVGTKIKVGQLHEFAREIGNQYQNDGFVLSATTVPKQDLSSGMVRIQVTEAKIAKVSVQGKYVERSVVDGIIQNIEAINPLNLHDLERHMLLLNDIPGVKAKVVMKPVDAPKDLTAREIELVIVLENRPFEHVLSADNTNSAFTGMYQAGFKTGFSNTLLNYQKTTFQGSFAIPSKELTQFQFEHLVPVSTVGTTLAGQLNFSHSHPGYHLRRSDVESSSLEAKLALAQSLIRSRTANWSIDAEFGIKRGQTEVADSKLYDDKLTILALSTTFNNSDRFQGANIGNFSVTRGIDMLGARETTSPLLSRSRGHSDFTRLNTTLGRLQRIGKGFNVYLSGTGQYAFSSMLASQEFGYGGRQFGRAFDPSEMTGDHGAAGLAELRYNGVPELWNTLNTELYAFYDIGKVWDITRKSVRGRDEGSSAGLGVRYGINEYAFGSFYAAKPLTRGIDSPTYGNPKVFRYFFTLDLVF